MLNYPKISIPESNGLIVTVFKKLEINLTADLAGLSEPLKLYQIEFASLLDKQYKLKFLVKTYSLVVQDSSLAVWDAMEDILMLLGLISRKLDQLLVTYMSKITIANHTLSLLVIIMSLDNTPLVLEVPPLLSVKRLVTLSILPTLIPMIYTSENLPTVFPEMKPKS